MRNKQRPTKSMNRHKSVTSVIDCPEISFQREERHGVMRLAFFENNDITPETWKDFDFNTLSTLILNRNIHQDLQEREQRQPATITATTTNSQATVRAGSSGLDGSKRSGYSNNSVSLLLGGPSSHHANYNIPDEQFIGDNDSLQHQHEQYSPEQAYSPEPVYTPPPVYVSSRRPAAASRSASRPAHVVSRPAHVARPQTSVIRPAHVARPAHGSRVQQQPAPPSRPNPVVPRQPSSASRTPTRQSTAVSTRPTNNATKAPHIIRSANIPQQQLQQRQSNTPAESKTFINHSGQFLCDEPDCGKTFPSLRKLRHHKVVHSDDFPFICQFKGCGKRFKRKFGIDLHSTTHFDLDPEMYEKTSNNSSLTFFGRRMQYSMCKPCNQKFKTVHDYQDHMLRHGKEPFKCLVEGCGQTFSIWKSFQKHRASHYFNYFCKMDNQCGHSTSNLQLLKLHIYCCHFRRTLPENATLSSKMHDDSHDDELDDQQVDDQQVDQDEVDGEVDDMEEHYDGNEIKHETTGEQLLENQEDEEEEEEVEDPLNISRESEVSTPRRDPRLRRNPPRSSTFGQQDYASINNGSSYAKLTASPQPVKRSRPSGSNSQSSPAEKKSNGRSPVKVLPKRACASVTSGGSQHSTPEKKVKSPLKVLPKRGAQRLPMSLIAADDGSTEDDDCSDVSSARNERCSNEGESGQWEPRFKCHLCDYKFSVRFQLTKHLSTHLELTPDMYSATADAKVIQLTERRRREFYCDKCNVKFEKMSDLDGHMRKHAARPYVCPFCPAPSTFRLAKQYLSHLYEHRFDYRCTMEPDCKFTINRKDALKLHIFRMHLNQQLPAYIENFASMVGCNEWTEQ